MKMRNIKKKINNYLKQCWKTFNQMEMRILPGNIAFFFVLALIPIVSITIYIASSFSISLGSVIEFVDEFLPKQASRVIIDFVSGRGFDGSVGTFNLIVFFLASNGTYAIINASNTMYRIHNSDTINDRVKSIVLLIILILLILFLILVPVLGGTFLNLFSSNVVISRIKVIYHLIKWPFTFFMIYVTLKLIYTIAPSQKIASKTTTNGALFTTICWTLATAIFSSYLKYFANYNIIYGNLSSIIILMIWVYIISYVFVMGIAINVVDVNEEKKIFKK